VSKKLGLLVPTNSSKLIQYWKTHGLNRPLYFNL